MDEDCSGTSFAPVLLIFAALLLIELLFTELLLFEDAVLMEDRVTVLGDEILLLVGFIKGTVDEPPHALSILARDTATNSRYELINRCFMVYL